MSDQDRSQQPDPEGTPSDQDHRRRSWLPLVLVAVVSLTVGAAIAAFVMQRRSSSLVTQTPSAAPASTVQGHAGMPGMEPTAGGDRPPGTGTQTVYISPARQQLIGVRTATIGFREIGTTLRTVGTLAYDETRVAQVHTKISGWIDRVYIDYVGRDVRQDEPLLTVYSPELVSTQTEYLLAMKNKAQLEKSSVPATRAAAESLMTAARDRLKLWDIPEEHIKELEESGQVQRTLMLHSPFNGIVLERNAFPGQYITPETVTFKVADLSTIWVLGAVFEYELPLIKLGQVADVEFPSSQSQRPLRGRITFIAPDVDPQTRRVRIRAEVSNPDRSLKPQTYVTVVVHTGSGRQLAIPKEAVIDNGDKQYAIVALPNGYFSPQEIRLGAPADEFYQLLGGLKEGDTVVSSAQFLIDSETNLQAAMQSMIGMHDMPTPEQSPATAPKAPPVDPHKGHR